MHEIRLTIAYLHCAFLLHPLAGKRLCFVSSSRLRWLEYLPEKSVYELVRFFIIFCLNSVRIDIAFHTTYIFEQSIETVLVAAACAHDKTVIIRL